LAHYAATTERIAVDCVSTARTLQQAILLLIQEPSANRLDEARTAWRAARIPYCQLEATRFYEGPIDRFESFINAWPVDERYIDAVEGEPNVGLIHRTTDYPILTKDVLVGLNEHEGKRNISTGFHAIEFLLWGQDTRKDGPGQRPYTDFLPPSPHHDRRATYLRIIAALLIEHLEWIHSEWAPDKPGNYRSLFLSMEPSQALAKVLKGLGTLTGPELAGERLGVAYETREQEDEHSCFSDNTQADLVQNVVGLSTLYFGKYPPTDGTTSDTPSIHSVFKAYHADSANRLNTAWSQALEAVKQIPHPFDQAVLGPNDGPSRRAVKQAIRSLWSVSDQLAKSAAELGLKLKL